MQFRILSSLALLAASAAMVNADLTTTKPFHLKTSGASNPAHNNLYVYAYHTGAGTNDAVLTPDVTVANPVILNETYTQFDLGESFPWGFMMDVDINSQSGEFSNRKNKVEVID
jgi:hypothetical protein